jgi:hypothetical protein
VKRGNAETEKGRNGETGESRNGEGAKRGDGEYELRAAMCDERYPIPGFSLPTFKSPIRTLKICFQN